QTFVLTGPGYPRKYHHPAATCGEARRSEVDKSGTLFRTLAEATQASSPCPRTILPRVSGNPFDGPLCSALSCRRIKSEYPRWLPFPCYLARRVPDWLGLRVWPPRASLSGKGTTWNISRCRCARSSTAALA